MPSGREPLSLASGTGEPASAFRVTQPGPCGLPLPPCLPLALACFGDEATDLEGDGGRHDSMGTSRGIASPLISEPLFGAHRIVVLAEDGLDVLCR